VGGEWGDVVVADDTSGKSVCLVSLNGKWRRMKS